MMSPDAIELDGMRFLRLEQVLDVIPVSRATLYRMIDKKEFPAPCRFGSSSVWPFNEVRAWSDKVKRTRGPAPKPPVRKRVEVEDFI